MTRYIKKRNVRRTVTKQNHVTLKHKQQQIVILHKKMNLNFYDSVYHMDKETINRMYRETLKKYKEYKKPTRKKKPRKERIDYNLYMNSKQWLDRKTKFFIKKMDEHKCFCFICETTENLVVHHASYKSLGNEKDEHLELLCKDCHHEVHFENGVKLENTETITKGRMRRLRVMKMPEYYKKELQSVYAVKYE